MKKSVYLRDIPLPEAQARLQQALEEAGLDGLLGTQKIPLDQRAHGRILAEAVWAKISSPHYHAAAMDGFAIRAADSTGASLNSATNLKVGETCWYVDTGDILPEQADAVIPIEDVEPIAADEASAENPRQPDSIRIRSAVPPWKHVRVMGEDIVATQLVLPSGHRLRAVDLGAIAASGHDSVVVARQPSVAVIPTGSELVNIGDEISAGKIIEYNSLVLAAQVESWGGQAERYSIVADEFEKIKTVVAQAAKRHDLILLNAGSSAGSEDYSAQVVEALGELLVHGVAVRPGHPVILGMINAPEKGGTPIIGVPGYPVSAALTAEIFVQSMLAAWQAVQMDQKKTIKATLTRKIASPAGDDEYVRVALGQVGDRMLAAPLSRGAGVITSLVRADGLAILPRGSQGADAGAQVDVQLYRSEADLQNTIFAVGSHDIVLDLLAQYLAQSKRRLTSSNVGSLAGLAALQRGEAHMAGSHLLDPQSGEYNLSYIKKYMPGTPVHVLGLVEREQGLLVVRNNPKDINGLEDLLKANVNFINRQRGAGTRLRLDHELDKIGIDAAEIQGYNRVEYSHLGLAAAIASGRADVGLGIAAAAHALELDFVPLFEERYDLIIPTIYYESDLLRPLRDLFKLDQLVDEINSMPGYKTNSLGKILHTVD